MNPESKPFAGPLTRMNVNGLPSRSEPVSVIGSAVSSGVLTDWLFANGASLSGVTVMLTVATALVFVPSLVRNVNESEPL